VKKLKEILGQQNEFVRDRPLLTTVLRMFEIKMFVFRLVSKLVSSSGAAMDSATPSTTLVRKTSSTRRLLKMVKYSSTELCHSHKNVKSGVKVFIDKKAQLTLLGTEMDFVESKLSAEFVFNNPNIKGTCGCGESFSI
jgi:Fe-S cluster assembly iron-binding protein IscA